MYVRRLRFGFHHPTMCALQICVLYCIVLSDTNEYLFTISIIISQLKSYFTQLGVHLLQFLCIFGHYRRYQRKQKGLFLMKHPVVTVAFVVASIDAKYSWKKVIV